MMNVDYVVYTIGGLVSYLNNALIYCRVTNRKFKFKMSYLFLLIIMGFLNAVVTMHLPIAIKPIYNLICLGLSIYFVKKDTIKSILFFVFVIWFLGVFLDILFMSLFSVAFKYLLDNWPKLGILVISLLLQVILYLFFRIKKFSSFIIKIKDKLGTIKNVVWMFLLIIFLVILFGVFAYKNISNMGYVFLFTALLIYSLFLGIFLLKILYEERTFKITIDNLLKNNKYYLEINNQDRVFKHNIIHRLSGIQSTADNKTTKLIDDIIKDYNLSSLPNKSIDTLPNGINGIICRAIYGNKDRDLNFAINNYLKSDLFEALTPRKYNKLCETLGVCLDNALGATRKTKEKILQVVMIENQSSIIIKIINTFDSSLEIDNLGSINYTTKKEGHGLGLYSLLGRKDVVLKTAVINNLFENQITIKKTKPQN